MNTAFVFEESATQGSNLAHMRCECYDMASIWREKSENGDKRKLNSRAGLSAVTYLMVSTRNWYEYACNQRVLAIV